ncbi:MAG: hypothetical protein EOP62_22380 [Sphingomonadales bacterium]|nr:MAG: hypothetical protein EOP62_22380 [Sphingomonadales bacterium]
MEVTLAQAEKLVIDVQVAHRLIVAYYEGLLARLDSVSKELDLDFWYWEPLETSRPCRSSTQPSRNWSWDMVPLYAATHIYKRNAGKKLRVGDVAICFDVYAENSFENEQRRKSGFARKADPLKLPKGEGMVTVEVYRCISNSNEVWDDAWHDTGAPDSKQDHWQDVGHGFMSRSIQIKLAELIHRPEVLLSSLRGLLAEVIP